MSEYIKQIREKVGHDRVIVVGAGVIIYEDRKILLQKRKDNLCWALHGGSVEIGEKVEDAAMRELYEETGLTANKLELFGVFSGENLMYTYPNGDMVCVTGIVYLCCDFSGDLQTETNETLDLKWFDIGSLPQKLNPPDIEPLSAFVQYIQHSQ